MWFCSPYTPNLQKLIYMSMYLFWLLNWTPTHKYPLLSEIWFRLWKLHENTQSIFLHVLTYYALARIISAHLIRMEITEYFWQKKIYVRPDASQAFVIMPYLILNKHRKQVTVLGLTGCNVNIQTDRHSDLMRKNLQLMAAVPYVDCCATKAYVSPPLSPL